MTTHTIPGELFLLLTDDAGRQDSTSYRTQALAAAAIAELALRERIALTEERGPKVRVLSTESTDLPVLDQALGALAELEGKSLKSAIGHRTMNLTEVIGEGFAAVGAVRRKDGWFTTTWPTHDDELETARAPGSPPPSRTPLAPPCRTGRCWRSCAPSGSHIASSTTTCPASRAASSISRSRPSRSTAPPRRP
ncbi:GPP34 family phosphoprotein [Brachybacterium sp. GPGPB12]|uniref:GPP34 family phosphoprotein n=1 Tax=Brachybacterium sp. GPGPB12 TaxID=3023517 RepID=UPI0031345B7F